MKVQFTVTKRYWFHSTAMNIYLSLLPLVLCSCASIFHQAVQNTSTAINQANQLDTVSQQSVQQANAANGNAQVSLLPTTGLTKDILYKLLVAEIAGQRGQLDISVQNYINLANTTHDIDIISRATHIAVYAQNDAAAKEAAQLWLAVAPDEPYPHQVLATVAFRQGDKVAALDHLNAMLVLQGHSVTAEQQLWIVANLFGQVKDKALIKLILKEIIADHQDDPELLFVYAQVLTHLAELQDARMVFDQVIALKSGNDNVIMAYATLLNRMGKSDVALSQMEKALQSIENEVPLRIFYARVLADLGRIDDAQRQFEILLEKEPTNTNVLFSLGLIHLHNNKLDDAKACFTRLSDITEYAADANYYLGRIAEQQGDLDTADTWYRSVSGGNNYFEAQTRIAILMGRQNKIGDAQKYLSNILTQNQREKNVLIQVEAEILSMAKRYQEAMDVYDKALEGKYDIDLLYSRAMLAEKMDKLDILERDLLAILQNDPNNVQALNALGYTLADRTDRYDEAYELIKRALKIKPNSYHILDSMGWVLYRKGCLDEAIDFLNKALVNKKNNPEISAHLGEVLWVKGNKEEAREIWALALEQWPDDERLLKVIKRFNE